MTEGQVSAELCGKKLRSEGLTFALVDFDQRIPKPGAQLPKGREVVFNLLERIRSLAL